MNMQIGRYLAYRTLAQAQAAMDVHQLRDRQ